MTLNPEYNKILAEALAKDDMSELGIGADVTINGRVIDQAEGFVLVQFKSYEQIWIPVTDINTYHPKEAEITEDKRRGK